MKGATKLLILSLLIGASFPENIFADSTIQTSNQPLGGSLQVNNDQESELSNTITEDSNTDKSSTNVITEDSAVDNSINESDGGQKDSSNLIDNQIESQNSGIVDNSDDSEIIQNDLLQDPNDKQQNNVSPVPDTTDDDGTIIQPETVSPLLAKIETVESATSRLGHIQNPDARIYTNINDKSSSFTAGTTLINSVFYIKKQAIVSGETYYLLSTRPSSVEGVVGWIKASDILTHPHVGVDHNVKTFYIKGTGSAYSKVWGGTKELIYENLSNYKNQEFKVDSTEKVGDNIWYHGVLDNKTVWIHSSYVTTGEESKISRLGHIQNNGVKIYANFGDESTAVTAEPEYTDTVFYIKLQRIVNGETYYLLSTRPSSEVGVVGWVKASEIFTHPHVGVDHNAKTFYIKGTGSAYSKVWGGTKELIYENLSNYKNQEFKVDSTEKVGDNIWYHGVLDNKTVWIHSSYVTTGEESKISRLGHIQNNGVKIYANFGDESTAVTAEPEYTDTVFYIKLQRIVNGETYYLLSTRPSSEVGVVGWVKASEIFTHPHVGVDHNAKTFYIKGTGSAYSKVWGGTKELIYENLSNYKNQEFKVDSTEKVGDNIWYHGVLDNKTVWIHSSYVTTGEESKISRLGHIQNNGVKIYANFGDESTAVTAEPEYTDTVFYIKLQRIVNGETYYLLSTRPSSEVGVVGWVKASEIFTHPHVGVDHNAKTFYIKGTGSAYSKVWGGTKELIYEDLSDYKNQEFKVDSTEKVGDNLWYHGVLNNKTVWIHESYLLKPKTVVKIYSSYDLGLSQMVSIQMAANPQTDKVYNLWIREDALKSGSIQNGKGTVEGDSWNLRRGPGVNYLQGGKVNDGTILTLYSKTKGTDGYYWYNVGKTSGWVTPDTNDLQYYINNLNFTGNFKDSLQFLVLSQSANVDIDEVNSKILYNKGVFKGKASVFVEGAKKYGLNEIYLISHALLETGNGTSTLANGVEVGKDSNGNLKVVTSSNRGTLSNIKKTYNMYGIGAKDSCPVDCGATYAYNAGWFTAESAIIGGASFIGNGYVNNGQDTLYKMRWNPEFASQNGYASHQYATDIGWAYKQTAKMYELYSMLDNYLLVLDIPKFN